MATTILYRSIDGTEAALGTVIDGPSGAHSVIADRPPGKDGGQGMGFNGGQLLAFAIGGCFANDLRSTAHAAGAEIRSLTIEVTLEFGGAPRVVTSARMTPRLEMADGSDGAALIAHAREVSVIRNSVQAGFAVEMGDPA